MNINAMIKSMKNVYWKAPIEMREWYRVMISMIPGDLGVLIRRQYYRKRFKGCGEQLIVSFQVTIYNPQNILAGDKVHIAKFAHLSAGGGISIGNNTGIGHNVKMFSVHHDVDSKEIFWHHAYKKSERRIEIGNDVFIGAAAIILPEVTIGDGCIIGAGSLVTKNIPPYCVAVGNPAKIIKERNLKG